MNLDGSDVFQVSNSVPVAGFNLEELNFTWAENDTLFIIQVLINYIEFHQMVQG